MPYYCKKPVIIQAEILEKDQIIETLKGPLQGRKGDYLITGIRGEKCPCKPDIFHETYYEVTEDVYNEYKERRENNDT